ncbi:MAG: biotin/lipoyl-binding protein [Candidatus Paceibacterota bacterium]|jgi:multidrug efflux pump subunit AcrA (membrane-fusion protein)
MKKIITFLSLIAILAGVFLTVEAIRGTITTPQNQINEESAYSVTRKDIAQKITLSGEVKESESQASDQSFDIAGKIEDIFVKEGDVVKKNDVLATISANSTLLEKERELARIAVQQAQANLNKAIATPSTQEIKYWDQSVVDEAKNYFNQTRANGDAKIAQAQNQVNSIQDELNLVNNTIAGAGQNYSSDSTSLKSSIQGSLIANYFVLDKAMWAHDRIQKIYFPNNDQIGLRVREKQTDAFDKYYVAKWYMDNQISKNFPAPDWAITDCLEYTKQALEKLSIAYQTTNEAFNDAFYAPRLLAEDRDTIDNARRDITKSLASITNSQEQWTNRNGVSLDNSSKSDLIQRKTALENSLRDATNNLNQVKSQAQEALNKADANLKDSYIRALKTKTINNPKNTASLETILKQAQEKYNQLLSEKTSTIKLYANIDGIVSDVLTTKGTWIQAKSPIIKIGQKGGLTIESDLQDKDVNLSDEVSISSEKYEGITWKGIVINITDGKATISFSDCINDDAVCSNKLSSGDVVSLEIKIKEKKNAVVVPKNYIIEKEGKSFVQTKLDKEIVLREIRTGIVNGEYIEALEGVSEGDIIYLQK